MYHAIYHRYKGRYNDGFPYMSIFNMCAKLTNLSPGEWVHGYGNGVIMTYTSHQLPVIAVEACTAVNHQV